MSWMELKNQAADVTRASKPSTGVSAMARAAGEVAAVVKAVDLVAEAPAMAVGVDQTMTRRKPVYSYNRIFTCSYLPGSKT